MKNIYLILICSLLLPTAVIRAQNAPVTTAKTVVTALPGNDVIIPVTVDGFNEIGEFALTLDYDPAVLVYMSAGVNPLVNNLSVSSIIPGRITMTRSSSQAISLTDESTIITITFHYMSGTSGLVWFDNGGSCEYKDSEQTPLLDSPQSDYYINGAISNKAAPTTFAPQVSNAAPGLVSIPVTVEDFINISSIDLSLEYDPLVLTYSGNTPNVALASGFSVTSIPGDLGKNKIIIHWEGAGATLADGSSIVDLVFDYSYENGFSYSTMIWLDDGESCEFSDADGPLWDSPASTYYHDGLVADQVSPIVYLPETSNALPGITWIPITVHNFDNIAGISLVFEYDPEILTFASEYNSPVEGLFVSNQSLPNGNNKITVARFGSAVSLDDDDILVNIKFNYFGSTSTLTFIDNGESCEFTDEAYNPLMDYPMEAFYHHGLITDQLAPLTYLPSLILAAPGNCQVPVTVSNFDNIISFNLILDYDPQVLTFFTATPNGSLTGSFSVVSTVPGRLSIEWTGIEGITLADGSQLILLTFNYGNGSTYLSWNDSQNGCEYYNVNMDPLYDQPEDDYYQNGIVTDQLAPVTTLPNYTTAIPGITSWIPVTVEDFYDITSLMLTFSYDPSVITYENEFSSSITGLSVGSQLQSGGAGLINLSWLGAALDLTDGDTIVLLKFTYSGNATSLTWLDDGLSCEYRDNTNVPLYDTPFGNHYVNGSVISEIAPIIIADTISAGNGTWVTVPVRVYNFTNNNSFSLTLDYDPDVLEFDCATPNISLTGSFYASATDPGRLEIGWFDVERTLPNNTELIYIRFLYFGGTTDLTWYNSGASCEYTQGAFYLPEYDLPTSYFYKNGMVVGYEKWTGAESTEWTIPGNWELGRVPGSLSHVLVSDAPVPANWPVFTGNFETGVNCSSLLIQSDAQMLISGFMTINPRDELLFSGTGTLKIGGDWKCFGTFQPGSGNIEFIGNEDSNIKNEAYPGGISGYYLSTFPVGMTPLEEISSILAGDDAHLDINIGFNFTYSGHVCNQLRMNTNGWVSLNMTGSDATSMHNSDLYTTEEPMAVLAPWWDNLKADGSSSVSYFSDPEKLTVEWKNVLSYNSAATTRLNFQVILYNNTNVIEFHYGEISTGTNNPSESASIGIKDAIGGMGHFIDATSATMNNISTCLVSTSNWPAMNYRFTPVTSGEPEEVFHKVTLSKTSGKLNIGKNVRITGITR